MVVHCDNMGAVAVVNSGYSKVPQIMHLLRCLCFIRALFQLAVWAEHIPGVQNKWVDGISRNNLSFLFSQVLSAAIRQTPIPHSLLSLMVEQQPDWTSAPWTRLFRRCFLLA